MTSLNYQELKWLFYLVENALIDLNSDKICPKCPQNGTNCSYFWCENIKRKLYLMKESMNGKS